MLRLARSNQFSGKISFIGNLQNGTLYSFTVMYPLDQILKTKHLLFYSCMLMGGASSFLLENQSNKAPFVLSIVLFAVSAIVFGLTERFLATTGTLDRLRSRNADNPNLATYILVRSLELHHAFLILFGWVVFAGNLLYMEKGVTSPVEWIKALLHIVQSVGLQTNRQYFAHGPIGDMLTIFSSIIGLGAVAFVGEFIIKDPRDTFGVDRRRDVRGGALSRSFRSLPRKQRGPRR